MLVSQQSKEEYIYNEKQYNITTTTNYYPFYFERILNIIIVMKGQQMKKK